MNDVKMCQILEKSIEISCKEIEKIEIFHWLKCKNMLIYKYTDK